MAIASLFGALLSLMKYVADPVNQLPAITYWLMGSLASVGYKGLLYCNNTHDNRYHRPDPDTLAF